MQLLDVDAAPSSALPYLGEMLDVMGYKGWVMATTDTQKRELLKSAIAIHRAAGTAYSIKRVLVSLGFANATITENPMIAGEQRLGEFTVSLNPGGRVIQPGEEDLIKAIIDTWKPASRKLAGLFVYEPLYLDGSALLNGQYTLDGTRRLYGGGVAPNQYFIGTAVQSAVRRLETADLQTAEVLNDSIQSLVNRTEYIKALIANIQDAIALVKADADAVQQAIDARTPGQEVQAYAGVLNELGSAVKSANSLISTTAGNAIAYATFDSIVGGNIQVLQFEERLNANLSPGDTVANTWIKRNLNTETRDEANLGSVANSGQMTVVAGKYRVVAYTVGCGCNKFAARLQNITDGVTLLISNSGETVKGSPQLSAGFDFFNTQLHIIGTITLTGTKVLELQMQADQACTLQSNGTTQATYTFGLGYPANTGNSEVYTSITFRKVG
jgi:phage tail P2-like protein